MSRREPSSPSRWKEVQQLFHDALARPRAERAAWLASATLDVALRDEVAALLAADDAADNPLDRAPGEALGTAPGPAAADPPVARVGPYHVERVLGRGGMGIVYLARHENTGDVVALKVLRAGVSDALAPTESRRRFLREIRVGERIQHPGIVPVIDSGEERDGRLWFAMPFVDGETLRERMKREGRLELSVAASIGRQVAEALAWLAERGIVHRDVKPDNVLLARDGDGVRAVLADLGVARAFDLADADGKLTATGVLVGTVRYMSPEQIRGEPIDASTDVFALGAVLYEALAGEPPYAGATQRILLRRAPGAAAPDVQRLRGDVPPSLSDALRGALSPDPLERPKAAALARAIASAFAPVA